MSCEAGLGGDSAAFQSDSHISQFGFAAVTAAGWADRLM